MHTRAGQKTEHGLFIGYSIRNNQVYSLFLSPEPWWIKITPQDNTIHTPIVVGTYSDSGFENTKVLVEENSLFGRFAAAMTESCDCEMFVPSLYELDRLNMRVANRPTYPLFVIRTGIEFSNKGKQAIKLTSMHMRYGEYRLFSRNVASSTFTPPSTASRNYQSTYYSMLPDGVVLSNSVFTPATVALFGQKLVEIE